MKRSGEHDTIPKGWRSVRLGDVLEICRNGLVCPQDATPEAGIPISRIETISNGTIDWTRVGYVTYEYDDPDYSVLPDDVLLSHINSVRHIGKVARKRDERPLIHGMNLIRLRFNMRIDSSYGFALLNWSQTKMYFERRAKKAVNQASINQQDIQALPLLLPPLPEQRAIAAVLDSIDDAIEHAEAVIAATEQLRDSLLHQLLTRGVPGWHPEWKDVPGLGTIPADWEVVRLGEVTEVVTGNTPPRNNSEFYGGQTPWVKPSDLLTGRFVHTSEEYLTDSGVLVSRKVRRGSVLVSCIGTIGEVAIADTPLCFNQQINALMPSDLISSTFLYWACLMRASYLRSVASKTAVPILNKSSFSNVTVPLPHVCEQQAIAATLDGVDETIEEARKERDRLQLLKESVADALLTGRVRVRVL